MSTQEDSSGVELGKINPSKDEEVSTEDPELESITDLDVDVERPQRSQRSQRLRRRNDPPEHLPGWIKFLYWFMSIIPMALAVGGIVVVCIFFAFHVQKINKREKLEHCKYFNASLLSNDVFQGQLTATFPDGSQKFIYFYKEWEIHLEPSPTKSTIISNKEQEEDYLKYFKKRFHLFYGGPRDIDFITWCRIDLEDTTNFRICYAKNPYESGVDKGVTCSERTLEIMITIFFAVFIAAATFIGYSITVMCYGCNYIDGSMMYWVRRSLERYHSGKCTALGEFFTNCIGLGCTFMWAGGIGFIIWVITFLVVRSRYI